MKKITKILLGIYVVIAFILTVNLLAYNQFNMTQFGSRVHIKLDRDVDTYKKGSLLITTSKDNYVAGDNVFYCVLKDEKCEVNYGSITTMMGDAPLINGEDVSKKLIVASSDNLVVVPFIGGVLGFLESRTIYLLVIVLPILVAFIYEVFVISKESKKSKKKK